VRRNNIAWALVAIGAAPLGGALGRSHLIAPTPGMFFALGVLATLSLIGVGHGVWSSRRIARERRLLGH
jgi:hypothetical protein